MLEDQAQDDDDADGDANHEEEDEDEGEDDEDVNNEEEDEEVAIKSVINGGYLLGGFAGARPPLPNGFITA